MNELENRPVAQIELSKLQLDGENPRFGTARGDRRNQTDILDYIVENFGIEDVLSSLAYNGYFEAEPLIAKDNGDNSFTVVEGNRRLSACLILTQDERAKNQLHRLKQFPPEVARRWSDNPSVPVHIFNTDDDLSKLNAYLGVRHITSAKAWDSYAKAAWIDSVVRTGEMTLEQICEVTGDKNRTIKRLLEGYYFINQLIESGQFLPKNSARKGRGSNPDFPFSWVYTLLDYAPVRDYLKLEDFDSTKTQPIAEERIRDASSIVTYMFGDRSSSRNPAIRDSRQLGSLAVAISDPVQREMLARGKSISEIEKLTKPALDQIIASLTTAKEEINSASSVVNSGKLEESQIADVEQQSKEVARLAAALYKNIRGMGEPEF